MAWIRFGKFELNGKTYELRKSGALVKIQQQPARVLALLAGNAGAVVTRNQIREAIWGSETFVDFEQNLNFCIRHIRMALDDRAEKPIYIETLPRLGYRFIAPVEQIDEPASTPSKTRVRIGVLPIEELGTAVEDYFTLGLTEDLISALSRVDSDKLRVVAGPRLRRDSASEAELEQIQRDLNLDFLLRGWVRRSANAIRICVQLHDLNDKSILWSETYDRCASDLPALQEEVTRRVSRSLAFELLPPSATGARKYAHSPAAYDLYLKGRYFWHKMTSDGMRSALHYFTEAVSLDPGCAPAYAGLADCYAQMGSIRVAMMKPLDALRKAKPLLERAMEMDNTLPEAHCTLGLLKSWYDLEWAGADQQFRQALGLEPDNLTALLWRSLLLSALGRNDEAIASVHRALESNPLSPIVNTYLGVARTFAGQFDLAIRQLNQAIELDPHYYRAYMFLGLALSSAGRGADAIAAHRKALSLNPENLESLAFMGDAMASAGDMDGALDALARLQSTASRYEPALLSACIYAGMGKAAEMFDCLQRAFEAKCAPLYLVLLYHSFLRYHSDPRYRSLVESLGLPPRAAPPLLRQYSG
jgi:TolB-like protein/Tfp pilus assembly protein PilF